jgi:hypothetical protein
VDGLIELIPSNTPIVHPLAPELRLLFVANNFRDIFSIVSCGLE